MKLHQAAHIAKHIAGRKFSKAFLPNHAVFLVTKRCNMRCAMCGVEKQDGRDDLSVDAYRKMFDTGLKRLDVVKISGGEPFIRKDATELFSYLLEKNNPATFHITTNGFYIDRIQDFIKTTAGRKLSISVSIDGPPDVHDEVRGVKGAFEHAHETLRMIKKDFKNVLLTVNCTISHFNYKNIDHFEKSLSDVNFDRLAYFIADANQFYDDPLSLKSTGIESGTETDNEHRKKILDLVRSNNRKQGLLYRMLNDYYMTGLNARMENGADSFRHDCMALWSYFRMEPNGDIIMCMIRPEVLGNIAEQDFSSLWFGEKAARFRNIVKKCNMCWKECEVIPSCVYSGNLIRHILIKH